MLLHHVTSTSDSSALAPGLRAFVDDDVALLPTGIGEVERSQLIELLLARGDSARLDRLGASPDKSLAKAARKALHVLRTRGVAPAVAPARVFRVAGPFAEPPLPSYASIVDGRGERIVWCVQQGDGALSIYQLELSETAGIIALTALDLGRKAWRDQVAHMKRSDRALVGEIPEWHARCLIEQAYRTTRAAGRAVPEGFAGHHLSLQASLDELAAPHPLLAIAGDCSRVGESEISALLDLPELGLLAPPSDAVTALDAKVGEIAASKPAAEEVLGRIEAAIVQVVDESLPPALRGRLADRFLELGLLIASRRGDAGLAHAKACVVAATRARDTTTAGHEHPLFIGMFRRLVPAELLMKLVELPTE